MDKEKYIKYNIELIVNKKLYEQNIIDYKTFILVRDKLNKLLYEL